ncbi:MAG: T9SS type A sorting domain-containing protein [Melioribacteraceae bacterium]|nr:T9SS type A sorting domain-containing protein [Melioribacteraceae bacterium]
MKKLSKSQAKCLLALACTILLISGSLFGQVKNPTHSHISYGSGSMEWLNLYLPNGSDPAPVFIYSHAKGSTANNVRSKWADPTVAAGTAIVSWESEDGQSAAQNSYNVFQWVLDNAVQYNLDANNIIIGGQSRGSIASWGLAHSQKAGIIAAYFGQALPDAAWVPSSELFLSAVTVNSPPLFLAYRKPFGTSDGHKPENGQGIIDRYIELGIGDRAELVANLSATSNNEIFQFLPDFIASVISNLTDVNFERGVNYGIKSNLEKFHLYDNYPNPFNPETTISFDLSGRSFVKLEIYNILGQLVKTIIDQELSPASYSYKWDGKDKNGHLTGTGIYLYRLESSFGTEVKKMTFMK